MIEKVGFNCVGCGACEGICPTNTVKVKELDRGYKPFVNRELCINCKLCVKVCPIQNINIPDDYTKIKRAYRCWSRNKSVYLKGASGGGVSSLLIYMFDKKLIDAALVTFYDKNLNLYGDFITDKNEVLNHSGAFYQQSKQLVNINKITRFHSVAVVGLPCHIEAVRRFAELNKLKNIYVMISLFCTIGRMKKGFEDFIKKRFNLEVRNLEFSEYKSRYGKSRLGDIILKTKDGKELIYKFPEYLNFVDYFYTPEGCFNCRKMFGLNADISIGDDWGIKTTRKLCLVSVNTDRGLEIFLNCNLIKYYEVSNPVKTLLNSQPIGIPLKVFHPPLKVPVLKLMKALGSFNTNVPLFRITSLIRTIVLLGFIKLGKPKAYER
ncbi:MAG: Coenzyme F420 hydrogenase/dehydrogenase, beta subunit C-terminal domain [Candidatus Bathyarchaeia archaeon]